MVQKLRKAKPQPKQEKVSKSKLSKFIKKKSKSAALTKRDNTYVFEGFYEKLKQIDVKQSNSLETNFIYDSMLRQTDENEEDGIFNSNFILLLRTERANNKTIEFGKVYKVLEPFCFSYPLLVLNKSNIISLLLHYLNPESNQIQDQTIQTGLDGSQPLYAIQVVVLDLLIALIKDFRSDIYQDFLNKILPTVIGVIDMQKVQIIDKVFMVISFGIKYLSKSIKEDITNFYSTYSELLIHKNRYLRKFSSQSLSYVLRKINFNENTIQMITSLLKSQNMEDEEQKNIEVQDIIEDKDQMTKIMGCCDLLFEVVYGAGEGLHSKFNEVLHALLSYYSQNTNNISLNLTIRCIFMKLINEVDTEKQQPIFDILDKTLSLFENESQLNLALDIYKDCIRIKYGKRLSNYGIIHIIQTFNKILVKHFQFTKSISLNTKQNITKTLSILYYFKHQQVKQILAKSNIDINDQKNIFTSHVYKLINTTENSDIQIFQQYVDMLLSNSSEIKGFDDLDWSSILGLKQSSNIMMEFSIDSHVQKIQVLAKSINIFVLKVLQDKQSTLEFKINSIAIFISLQRQVNSNYQIEINESIEHSLQELIKYVQQQLGQIELYICFRYLSYCKLSQSFIAKIIKDVKINHNAIENKQIKLDDMLVDNLILKNYNLKQGQINDINLTFEQIIDTHNRGISDNINNQICMLINSINFQNTQDKQILDKMINLLINNHNDIIILRSFNQCNIQNLSVINHQKLFIALTNNLLLNQNDLREQSLIALTRFNKLNFKQADPENEKHHDLSDVYKGHCSIIDLMLQFEQTKISFETEKTKILLIKKIETILNIELVPDEYVEVAFKFLIGCYWIKFTPIFEAVQDALASIIVNYDTQRFAQEIIQLIHNMGLIIQIGHDNDQIISIIDSKQEQINEDNLLNKCYLREQRLNDEFLEVKDYYFNLTKTLQPCIDMIISKNETKSSIFDVFFEFIDKEYQSYVQQSQEDNKNQKQLEIIDRMTHANMIDSEQYKQYRKQTYSKLYCFIELFNKSDKLTKIPRIQDFQSLMLRLISSSDTKLQKLSLDCLIKTDYKGGILRHYRKLLEGLTDDEKFKDVITAINFGSSKAEGAASEYPGAGDKEKKQDKSAIPKLQDIHRLDVLPVIIKLLLSKLQKKKGSINKKSIHIRRNIVYGFMSTLKQSEELKIFINETLQCFDIQGNNKDLSNNILINKLSQRSFSVYLNFINSLSVIIKQLGSVMESQLPLFTKVLITIMTLTKQFISQMKLSLVTTNNQQDQQQSDDEMMIDESDHENFQQDDQKESLYRFVGQQSKICMRKSLGVVIQLYQKFSYNTEFVNDISTQFFNSIAKDQLDIFNQNYISDKSQLVEILSTQWSQNVNTLENYIKFEKVFPTLINMLKSPKITPEVYELLFTLLKSLIGKSIQGIEDKKELFHIGKKKKNNKNVQEEVEVDQEQMEIDNTVMIKEREISQTILTNNIKEIAQSLHEFSKNNLNQLKNALLFKNQHKKKSNQAAQLGGKQNVHETNQQTIKDLIFIISEITNYLQDGDELNQDFLDMTINILSLKPLHKEYSTHTNSTTFQEELMLYGSKSICLLLTKCKQVSQEQIERILIMFLTIKSLKVRNVLSKGLQDIVFNKESKIANHIQLQSDTIEAICNLNKIKRGLADVELDYDLIIKTIEVIDDNTIQKMNHFEIRSISYSIIFLLQSEEFSVRDYASHFLKKLFDHLDKQILTNTNTVQQEFTSFISNLESFLVQLVKSTHDELILKTILEALRHHIMFIYKHQNLFKSQQNLQTLHVLIGTQQDQEDFFTRFLAIKLKTRAKAIQFLIQKLDSSHLTDYTAIQAIILPLLNYVIFGAKFHKENRRNTVTYSKEEKRMTMDEALKAYQAVAKQLKWSDYYKMLKQLVFKLNKTTNQVSFNEFSGSNKGEEGDKQKERIITKCICKVLNGFNFEEVPDAINQLSQQQIDDDNIQQDQDFERVLQNILTKPMEQQQEDVEMSEDENDNEQQAEKNIEIKQKPQKQNQLADIQQKLYSKVLPILERHLTDYQEQDDMSNQKVNTATELGASHGYGSIRSFVVLSIVRLIRKLPQDQFQNQLGKLINNIISKGLRSRILVHREKARKGLLKLIVEVGPQYLSLVFTLMNDLLTRGYQLQTYIFTILYLLQQLQEKKILQTSMITHKLLEITSEKIMDELFGELTTDQKHAGVEDQQKNKIKEAKGKKAIPIFEIYAQYIDFKKNFFTMIGPILRSLEGNPSIGKIQQCEELLNRISSSIIKNQSVKGDQLLMFMYTIIDKGVNMAARIKINDDRVQRDYGAKTLKEDMFIKTKQEYKEMTYKVEMKWAKGNQLINDKKAEELSGRVMASFGLMCLKKALKNKGLILSNESDTQNPQISTVFMNEDINAQIKKGSEEVKEELKAKLDPFVSVLLNAFKTYHNPIVVSTLHVLGMIINLGLPSFKQLMKKFLNRLFKLFEQTSTSSSAQDSDFINSLFKCTAELIKTYSTYQDLSEQQLKTLLQVIRQNLNSQGSNNPSQINVFHLLRALVFRKFLSPDLYDIIDKNVQDLIVTSLSSSIRSLCASIFVSFLIEYPLEESRLTHHMNYLLKNVGTYFDSEGRSSILEVMERLSEKMPTEIMDNECEKWIFTLMIRLVNEKYKKCKDKVAQVLKKLFIKISANKAKTIFNTIVQMTSDNPVKKNALLHAKLHLIGIIIDATPQLVKNQNEVNNIISIVCYPVISEEYLKIKEQLDSKQQQKQNAVDSDNEFEQIQNPEMKKFLQNIDLIESNDGKQMQMQDDESEDKDLWSPLYFAIENIQKLVISTETQKVSIQAIMKLKNFLRTITLINHNHHVYWIKLVIQKLLNAILDSHKQPKDQVMKTFNLNDSQDFLKSITSLLNSFKILPMTQEISKLINSNTLGFLKQILLMQQDDQLRLNIIQQIFKRLSLIGRKIMLNISQAKERLQCILQFFTDAIALFEQLSENQKDNILTREACEPILQLVYRVYTDEQYLPNTPPKTLSYSMVDYFSQNLDKPFFLKLYNDVKKGITEKRLERKRAHKVMMVSNAAEWEQIKSVKRDKKKEKKREKKRLEKMIMALQKT